MKHFTRFLSLFLGAVMILTMAACGSKNTDTDTDTKTGSVDVPQTAAGGRCEIRTDTGDIKIEIE